MNSSTAATTDEVDAQAAPQIRVINPPALPTPWTLHERIGWAAQLGLALVGYLGVLVALRMLRQNRSQLQLVESLAQAAIEAANAATMQALAVTNAQRPWIRISIERSRDTANTLHMLASNHGKMPAEIIDCPDKISLAAGVHSLHPDISKEIGVSEVLKWPIVLMPGESTVIQRFGRNDAKRICRTEEALAAVKRCEQSIFIFGRVIYREVGGADKMPHRTDWCFRYVHGESISDLVVDGPLEYNGYA